MKFLNLRIGAMALLAVALLTSAGADEPYWKRKEKVYKRIENREILVSVLSKEDPRGQSTMTIRGGGQVPRPCDEVFARAQQYEKAAKASAFVSSAQFDSASDILAVKIEAFGRSANIRMQLKAHPTERRIDFKVVDGPMTGLSGRYDFFIAKTKKCDVGIDANYSYSEFPLPRFFLEFALEVMFQKMAGSLRQFVEESSSAVVN